MTWNIVTSPVSSDSHPSQPLPTEAAEAGEDQRLPSDGRGIHPEPGTDETVGGEAGGVYGYGCGSASKS